MKRTTLRLFPLVLLVLCLLLVQIVAKDASTRPPVHDAGSTSLTARPEESQTADEAYVAPKDAGQDTFDEAAAMLRRIKPPTTSKLAKFVRKPKGILGTTAYYAKEAFMLLFLNAPQQTDIFTTSTSQSASKLSPTLAKAVSMLKEAADEGNRDATFLLAEINFHGNFSHPVDYDEAFERYRRLADIDGNSTAQYMLGFIYATGLAPSIASDQAKSMLYHTFAAMQGNTRSEMTLAYRHHSGVATPRSCDEAVHWYKRVADKAIEYYRSGPPGGHSLIRDAYRIPDEDGGVYGEGASVSSSGPNARQGGVTSDAYADVEDVLEYLHLQASKGDLKATFGLARLHYDGARSIKRDMKSAKKYFMEVAREYWASNGKVKRDVSPGTEKLASKAAGYLGRMFLRGEGIEQSYAIAKVWFTRGLSNGDALSQYSLGVMYLYGLGVEQDTIKASDYFAAAADQDLAVAQTNLGMLFLDQGDTATATRYFELAVRNSHIEAFYYLAEMNNYGIGRDRSCGVAAVYYKIVAEKAEPVWSSLNEAAEAYENGDRQKAMLGYLMAAEQGSENAQFNVAWLLDSSASRWSPLSALFRALSFSSSASSTNSFSSSSATSASSTSPSPSVLSDDALALIHWTRSAKQHNIDSMVKMGDAYLAGAGSPPSAAHAAACYQAAADTQHSAQALWNLGWMHENGVGLDQDFHLAKRFYDQALETNREAYLPVKLSLVKLRWRSWWNGITRGGVHGIEEEPAERKHRSLADWIHAFLEADAAYYLEYFEEDDWEAGAGGQDAMPGPDGFWAGRADEEVEDGLMETLVIGGLVAALGWLIYYRQQQQRLADQRRRQQAGGADDQAQRQHANDGDDQAAAPPQRDRGVLPNPGDPEWNDWMAGAIGP